MRFQLLLQSLGGKTGSRNPAKDVEVGPAADGVGEVRGSREALGKAGFHLGPNS